VNSLREQGFALPQALAAVGLSKSSYFYQPRARSPRPLDPLVVAALERIEGYELVYGYRKVTHLLRRWGVYRNYKCIYRHLKARGQLQPRKRKGRPHQVLRAWEPTASNQRWEADLAVVPCGVEGQAYGIAFLDCFDKEVIGAVFSQRCRAEEVETAFWQGLFRRFPNGLPRDTAIQIVLRVDRGGQFIAQRIREVVRGAGLHLEVCGVQTPNDKPYIESFLSHYKTEEVYRNWYADFSEAKAGWESYLHWYRRKRLHASLGYRTVAEVASAPRSVPLAEFQPREELPSRSPAVEAPENNLPDLLCQAESHNSTPVLSPA
jgi:putative transposase